MKQIKQDRGVFRQMFLCITAVILIPLLILGFCTVGVSVSRSIQQMNSATLNTLDKEDQLLSYTLNSVNQSLESLARNPSIIDFAMRPYRQDTSRSVTISTLMSSVREAYSFVENVYIVSPISHSCLNASGALQNPIFLDLDSLTVCVQTLEQGLQVMIPQADGDVPPQDIYFSVSLPLYSRQPVAQILLQAKLAAFMEEVFQNGNSPADNICVFSGSGTLLFTCGVSDGSASDLQNIYRRQSYTLNSTVSATVNGQNVRLTAVRSQALSWTYLKYAPLRFLDGGASLFIVFLGILISIILGVLLAYQNSLQLYRPLEELVSSLPEDFCNAETVQNEYQRISRYYDTLLNQQDEVRQQIDTIQPVLRERFLTALANGGTMSAEDLQYQLDILHIPTEHIVSAAILVQIDHYYHADLPEQQRRTFKEHTKTAIHYPQNSSGSITAAVSEDTLLLLMIQQTDISLLDAVDYVKNAAEAIVPSTVSLGISTVCQGLSGLTEACRQARQALSCKLWEGDNSILYYGEIQPSNMQSYIADYSQYVQLVNHVRAGSEHGVRQALNQIFAQLNSKEVAPGAVLRLVENLTSVLVDLAHSAQLSLPASWEQEMASMLNQQHTLSDIQIWLTAQYLNITVGIRDTHPRCGQANAEKIKTYIDQNFTKDISLTSISEAVNYSPAYVSKIFRQQYGTNYTDYLNAQRIELAKQLLANEALSAKEIGFQTGFNNLQTFFRIFKKYTGMTPLQYRENKR